MGLGRAGGSGGEGVFLAVPNCLGFGTANLLTHMSLLPPGLNKEGGGGRALAGTRGHSPRLTLAARRRALGYVTV